MDKIVKKLENTGFCREKMEIIFYYIKRVVIDEMKNKKLSPIDDFSLYEKEKFNFIRKTTFSDSDNIKLLNLSSVVRVYIKDLNTREEFIDFLLKCK